MRRPDHCQHGFGQSARCPRVPQRTQFRGLDRTDRPRSRHRRQASAWAYLQAGGPHAAGAADHWSQCLSAPAANARRQRSVAADLLARRPYKVVMVALAAKTARIIWAMLAKGE